MDRRDSRRAERDLADLPAKFAEALRADLVALAIDPQSPVDVRKLEPKSKGVWRIRVGDYRILFMREKKTRVMTAISADDRKDAY